MRLLLSALLILLNTIFVAPTLNAEVTPKTPIIIGAIYNLTGEQAPLDVPAAQGAQLAVNELNRAGGILGRPVQLVLRNGQSQPHIIQQQAKQLARNPAISIAFGLNDTNMVLAAAPELAQAHKLFITSGATSPNLPLQIPDYLFLACFSDNMQATALANYAYNQLDSKKAYVMLDEDMSYTILLAQYFEQAYKNAGGQVVGFHTFKQGANIAHQLQILKTIKPAPAVIFLAADPTEAPQLIKQIRASGFQQPILGGDSFDSSELLKALGEHANNIYFSTHGFINRSNANNQVQEFIDKYQKHYHYLPANSFAALGYDTVKLIAAAVTNAQSTNPIKVRQALYALKNWPAVTGPISYNNKPMPDKPVVILKIYNGKQLIA